MSIVFTKDEIKEFLKEQGFDVEDEEVLRKFILDLKKLIKYEEMKKRRHRLGHLPEETVLDSTEDSSRLNQTTGETSTSSGRHPQDHDHSSEHQQSSSGSNQPSSYKESPETPDSYQHHRPGTSSSPSPSPSPIPARKRSEEKSYYNEERDVADMRSEPQPQPTSSHGIQRPETRPRPFPSSAGAAKENAKGRGRGSVNKPGSRLIMTRVTATTDDNGEPVVQKTTVDLGPVKRPGNVKNRRSRPSTAPARPSRRPPVPVDNSQYKRAGESRGREDKLRKPSSARVKESSRLNKPSSRPSAPAAEEPKSMDPDELFYVLSEIMFPDDESGSGSADSLLDEKSKAKKPIQPPPDVAIDPVALYHWYKKHSWDVHPIPGEDRHMKLRWNVRAKTIGGFHQCI